MRDSFYERICGNCENYTNCHINDLHFEDNAEDCEDYIGVVD